MFLVYNDVSFHGIYHSIQATADYIAAGVICMSLTLWLFPMKCGDQLYLIVGQCLYV